jgi:CRP-like cAMP-binding protein
MHDRKIESWISKPFPPETPFLELVPQHVRNALIQSGDMMEYEPGQIILRRGAVAEFFFMVQMGEVVECGKKHHGRYTEQILLPKGQCFGEHSILAGIPVTRTWMAQSPVTLITMPKERFISFLIEHPGVLVVLYRLLAEKLRRRENTVDALLRPGVQGDLSTQSFMDIAQSFLNSSKTGIVTLENAGTKAVIGFNDGQICYAKSREGEGTDVLDQVVRWEEGKFSYEHTGRIETINVMGDTMGILLDALRQLDEGQGEPESDFQLF